MRKRQKIINLYQDSSVRSIKHVISVGNEEDLNQFWHYFHSEVTKEYKLLYRFIGILYAFSARLFEENEELFFELFVEENDDTFYFTVRNDSVSKALRELLRPHDKEFECRVDEKRITLKFAKDELEKRNETDLKEQEKRRDDLLRSVKERSPIFRMHYDFLQEEDREEVLQICDEMTDIMDHTKKIGLNSGVCIRLRSCLSMFSLSMLPYPQLCNVVNLVTGFSVLINTHQSSFEKMSPDNVALVEGFIRNIDRWANTLFVEGGADLHFMDNSLKADLEMIRMRIEPQMIEEDLSLEGIFDF